MSSIEQDTCIREQNTGIIVSLLELSFQIFQKFQVNTVHRQTCFEVSGDFVSPTRSDSESCEVLYMLVVVTTSDWLIEQAVKVHMKCCCMRSFQPASSSCFSCFHAFLSNTFFKNTACRHGDSSPIIQMACRNKHIWCDTKKYTALTLLHAYSLIYIIWLLPRSLCFLFPIGFASLRV